MNRIAKIAWLLFCFLAMPAIAWLGGYDFDHRGDYAANIAIATIIATALGASLFL